MDSLCVRDVTSFFVILHVKFAEKFVILKPQEANPENIVVCI